MSDTKKIPLTFACFNCGKTSQYPNYLPPLHEGDPPPAVSKRCLTCGIRNEVTIPIGFAERSDSPLLSGQAISSSNA